MRRGTPGFVGGRLREAREVRKLTIVSLSEIAEVSPQAISQYEHDQSSPSPDVLRRMTSALNLPESFFLLPERAGDVEGTVFYRSMSSTTKSARVRAEHRYVWLRDIVGYVSQYVALPESDFPVLNLPHDPLLLSDDDIEEAASDLRRHWGLREAPIANTVLLLENQGAVIARDRLGADSLDGLSRWVSSEHRPYIMVGIDKGSPSRWRFDVAHELGHLMLHAHVEPGLLAKTDRFKLLEAQAHRFAAAFLLPFGPFSDDLFGASLDAFEAIKPKWKVAISMMITRAYHGGLIDKETRRKLMINLSRRGWRRLEPYDDTMEIEEPRLLRRSLELIIENGAQTPADVVDALSLPAQDIETLSGLPSGFLSGFSPVTLLEESLAEPNRARRKEYDHGHPPADVIALPLRKRT